MQYKSTDESHCFINICFLNQQRCSVRECVVQPQCIDVITSYQATILLFINYGQALSSVFFIFGQKHSISNGDGLTLVVHHTIVRKYEVLNLITFSRFRGIIACYVICRALFTKCFIATFRFIFILQSLRAVYRGLPQVKAIVPIRTRRWIVRFPQREY